MRGNATTIADVGARGAFPGQSGVNVKAKFCVGVGLLPRVGMAVVIEPWKHIGIAIRPLAERAAVLREAPRVDPNNAEPFGPAPLTFFEEFEIAVQYLIWMGVVVLPLLSPLWLLLRPSLLSLHVFCFIVFLSMVWPNGEWPIPPRNRLTNPLRNRKVASAFMRYFPMRIIVEDPDMMLSETRSPTLFAGVPHGLFPIGFVLLGFCNFSLPWRRIRAAAASITLRLPIWRQVSLWNGGVDVSKETIVKTLKDGDDLLVAMDGIAGMFAGGHSPPEGKEVFLLKRRKGLVKIALQRGSPLVPFVCFGNTKAVTPIQDRFGIMEACSRLLGVSLIYPRGRFLLPIPRSVPVTVCIGKALPRANEGPIAQPSEAQVDELHERLMRELAAIYYRWRVAGGYAGVELQVV